MSRAVLMGDPTHFSVRGGANPHTRNALGIKKSVDAALARQQWHRMARVLIAHGCEVFVIPSDPLLPGLVYPANAGFLYPLERTSASAAAPRTFHLAHLLPTRAAEREVYRPFIRKMGFATREIMSRFEGEADFFPAGEYMIFTCGRLERQRFVPQLGFPPWKRVYGFRSDPRAVEELRAVVGSREILSLELINEAHYHGDTVLCSFGARRSRLLAYPGGLAPDSRRRLAAAFGDHLIELSAGDAARYAANAFQVEHEGRLHLFLPEGVSGALLGQVRGCGVEPVTVNVSEFLAKGGGSIKCMILDLGPIDDLPPDDEARAFRDSRSYRRIFMS